MAAVPPFGINTVRKLFKLQAAAAARAYVTGSC